MLDGTRKTYAIAQSVEVIPDTVFMFGGSALWGDCARDEFTIASFVAKRLEREGKPLPVLNYGERGYTFTQGVLRLLLLLRAGKRPSNVIFYDGANDVIVTHYAGRAGVIYTVASRCTFRYIFSTFLTKLNELFHARQARAISKEKFLLTVFAIQGWRGASHAFR